MKARLVDPQDCPHQVKFIPPITPAATSSGFASPKAIRAFLPPSSSMVRLTVSDAAFITARPVGTLPIRAIMTTSGCRASRGDQRVGATPCPGSPPPRTYIKNRCRKNPANQFGKPQRGKRGLLRWLYYHGIAGGERRRRFSRAEHEGMIEGDYPADDAQRFADREIHDVGPHRN